MENSKIPTQFLIIKDLVLREDNISQILDTLGREIVELEDQNMAIDHNMMKEFSLGAGLHPHNITQQLSVEVPKRVSG